MMTEIRLEYLFAAWFAGRATVAEKEELAEWVQDPANEDTLELQLENSWNSFTPEFQLAGGRREEILQSIIKAEPTRIISFRRRWLVAATLIALLGLAAYFFINNSSLDNSGHPVVLVRDVKAPAASRAMITLSDGRKVYVDSAVAGSLATQDNMQLVKFADGQLAYQSNQIKNSSGITYNTLENPRGSKVISMMLADGSKVWLNAGSSFTYPVSFIGNQRSVSMTGEAYFEVTHDKTRPFRVSKGTTTVEVLGTHFNINAYEDEPALKVTLLEGAVKVNSTMIKPGQQAIVGNQVEVSKDIDLEEVMAWKNGRFQFGGAGIDEVMRQVARWYDVEVIYEARPSEQHFRGGISREVPASKLFQMLESTGVVHFRIEGKKVYVIK